MRSIEYKRMRRIVLVCVSQGVFAPGGASMHPPVFSKTPCDTRFIDYREHEIVGL